jgi:hypothetical protein
MLYIIIIIVIIIIIIIIVIIIIIINWAFLFVRNTCIYGKLLDILRPAQCT